MIWNILILAVLAGLGAYIGLPTLLKPYLRHRLLRRVRGSGAICLTFDDGPNPASTPQILEILDQFGVKATFFILGKKAREHPELVRAIRSAGHQVGEHGYAHAMPWLRDPVWAIVDMLRAGDAIRAAGGNHSPVFYRPPYGKLNLATLLAAWLSGRAIAFWDVDPRDYACSDGDSVASAACNNLHAGSVILLHDGRLLSEADADATIHALPTILRHCREKGLRLATLSEACSRPAAISSRSRPAPRRIS